MQSYGIVRKWAILVAGIGAVFATIGILTYIRQDFIFSRIPPCQSEASLCSRIGIVSIQTAGLGIMFYGGLFVLVGTSILIFQHLRNHKVKETMILENEQD